MIAGTTVDFISYPGLVLSIGWHGTFANLGGGPALPDGGPCPPPPRWCHPWFVSLVQFHTESAHNLFVSNIASANNAASLKQEQVYQSSAKKFNLKMLIFTVLSLEGSIPIVFPIIQPYLRESRVLI